MLVDVCLVNFLKAERILRRVGCNSSLTCVRTLADDGVGAI